MSAYKARWHQQWLKFFQHFGGNETKMIGKIYLGVIAFCFQANDLPRQKRLFAFIGAQAQFAGVVNLRVDLCLHGVNIRRDEGLLNRYLFFAGFGLLSAKGGAIPVEKIIL